MLRYTETESKDNRTKDASNFLIRYHTFCIILFVNEYRVITPMPFKKDSGIIICIAPPGQVHMYCDEVSCSRMRLYIIKQLTCQTYLSYKNQTRGLENETRS